MHASDSAGNPVANLASASIEEKPQNGLAGLKHWRSDMLAGLMVSLVSLPFSLAIAISSGAVLHPASGSWFQARIRT